MSDRLAIIQATESIKEIRKIIAETRPLVSLFKDLTKETKNFNNSLRAGRPREYADAMQNLTNITRQYNSIQRQASSEMERLSRIERNNAQASAENARARRENAAAAREEARARQAAARETERERRRNEDSISAYKRFSREVLEAKNKAKNLGAEMLMLERQHRAGTISTRNFNRQMNDLSRQFVEARTRALGLHDQLRRLDASVGDNQRNVGNYKSALSGLSITFRNLIAAFGVTSAIDMFSNIIKSSFETIKVLNAQNVALNQIFETQTQVAFQQEFLRDITNRLGLELVNTTAAYTKYSASVKDTSLEGEKARHIFSAFAGASAKLGLNADAQTGIFKALEQMISKGTVQAEELRGQLGDRMPGAFKLFAKAAGVSTRELGEMLKKGDVLSAEILPKVADQLDKTYSLDKATKADTLVAAQNRFTNSWTNFLNQAAGNKELINGLATGMEFLGDVLNFLIDTLLVKGTDGVSVLDDLVSITKSLYEVLISIAKAFGIVDDKTKNTIFSLNAFKNDLKNVQSIISVVSAAVRGLADTISAFFETMFQDDGWDKFMKRMNDADERFNKILDNAKKTEAGIKKANAEGKLYSDEPSDYIKAWTEARKAKQAYFQLNGKYFSTATGKNTGKSLDDYIDDGSVLRKKVKSPIELGLGKDKQKAASLTAAQKDQMNIFQAERDTALAYLTQRQNEGLINEQQFQEKRIQIIKGYAAKVSNYLKGNNAKEKQVEGSVILRASTEIKNALKEQFDYFAKQSEETYKKTVNSLERQAKELEKNDFLTDTQRLEEQVKLDNQSLEEATKFYNNQIDLANSFHQDTLELERKRDDEVGKIQDSRADKMRSNLQALQRDLERQTEIATSGSNIEFEEQKSLILSDKKLSNDEKAYRISLLEIDKQITQNRLKIEELKSLKAEYDLKVAMAGLSGKENPEAKRTAAELAEQIITLENANTELNNQAKDTVSAKTQAIRDTLARGFAELGFEGFADAYSATMERLKNDTASWKDYAVMAAAAVLDSLTQLNNRQKEQTIASLDEQLKHSQETTEQEIGFINQRLEYLNNLDELSKEQISERNRLEDEARTLKEQQQQREKLIETQKAKAEQKAAAQQALINGALAATMTLAQMGFIAGAIPAALALAFGIAQSIAISSKNPVPQYFVGRKSGPAEFAWTQEKGRELITDKRGNIKSLGSESGAQMTWLDKDDIVHTASETKSYIGKLKELKEIPKIGSNIFQKVAMNSLQSPSININKTEDYSQKIIDGLAQKLISGFGRELGRNTNPNIQKINGFLIEFNGSKVPVTKGTYDLKTGEETWYQ